MNNYMTNKTTRMNKNESKSKILEKYYVNNLIGIKGHSPDVRTGNTRVLFFSFGPADYIYSTPT